jgi:CHAT domain-containing protein
LGENEEALALHMRALKIREQRLGDDHPSVATSLSNLAVVLERLGRSEEARRCYERSIRIKELRFGPDHPDLAMTLHSLAVTLGKAGKVGEARPLHYRAVEIDMRRLGADHPDVAQNLSDLMHLAVIAGQLDEARQLAVRTCKSRLAWLRREIPLATERSRLRYAGEAEHDVSVLCQLAVGSGFDAGDAAFALAASWKGIVFRSARVASSQRETWTAEQHKLAATIQSLQATASKLGYQRDVADPQAHASQLRGVLADLERSQVELARGLGLRFDDADVSVSDFARLLPLGTALIDFLVTSACDHDIEALRPRLGSRRLLAWVLRSGEDHAALVDLGSADAAEARVGAFLEARRLRSAATGPNDELDRSFWQPLAEHLNGVETVFVCPDQFLGRLSLAGIRTSDGRYLIERYRFLYMQDAGSLAAMLRAGPRARAATPTLLAVGGVDYDQRAADASSTPAVPAAPSTTDSRGLAKRWQPLPQSKTEVEAIAGIHVQTLPAAARRLVLLGMEPTEERVKTEASRFTLLHFATHGYFESKGVPSVRERTGAKTQEGMERRRALYRPDSLSGLPFGLLSGLALAGSNRRNLADREEGLLTAEEVAWLPLGSCDLVVLSACETGIGMARGGEGMLSLRRAFHLAGAQTVISSLSRVEDAATERLMTEFYRRLWGDKVSPHEAFRAAQLALLRHYRERDQRDPRPDTWGAFVLSGEWR